MTLTEISTSIGINVVGPILWGAAGYVASQWRQFKRSKKHSLPTQPDVQRDSRIHELLGELRWRLGDSVRAYVNVFHNGDEYPDGSDIKKLSRTHEAARSQCSYLSEMWSGLLISSVPDLMKLMLESGPSFTVADTLGYTKFRGLCAIGGADAVAVVGIYVRTGRPPIAMIGVDFDKKLENDGGFRLDPPSNLQILMEYAVRISALLSH